LKIDRMFLVELEDDERNRAIVRSIIGLANGLGCHVTAEGVESRDIAAWLAAAGCQCAQGFLFSRPLPCEELVNRYRQRADTGNVHRQHPLTTLEGSWT
jgi:EAL domain-containing protein (putative c-di-GMP-specific phosphodiesterase class I)